MSEYVRPDNDASGGTNRSAPTKSCATCGGDGFVTVRLRAPEQTLWMSEHDLAPSRLSFHEEVAPCYVCNLAGYEQLRTIDPARARALHAQ
jgi:hypothetical protein